MSDHAPGHDATPLARLKVAQLALKVETQRLARQSSAARLAGVHTDQAVGGTITHQSGGERHDAHQSPPAERAECAKPQDHCPDSNPKPFIDAADILGPDTLLGSRVEDEGIRAAAH